MSETLKGGVQSVARAFDLVEVIAARGGAATLSELAAVTGLPAATAHRLLRTLISCGYLIQMQDRRYGLSKKLVPIGDVAARRNIR